MVARGRSVGAGLRVLDLERHGDPLRTQVVDRIQQGRLRGLAEGRTVAGQVEERAPAKAAGLAQGAYDVKGLAFLKSK